MTKLWVIGNYSILNQCQKILNQHQIWYTCTVYILGHSNIYQAMCQILKTQGLLDNIKYLVQLFTDYQLTTELKNKYNIWQDQKPK